MPKVRRLTTTHPISTAYFLAYIYTPHMRQYMVDMAKSLAWNREDQEDLLQEGWIRIMSMSEGLKESEYRREGLRAMKTVAQKDYRRRNRERKALDRMIDRVVAGESVYVKPTPKQQRNIRYYLRKSVPRM